jgi:integrase
MSRQYRYLELALVIAEVTGRRISAVVQLWRSDFEFDAHNDFANATIRWRAATDKMGVTRTLPLDPHIARALHGLVSRFEVVGDVPLFAQVRNRNRAVAASELGKWLTQAEEIAGLEKLPGGRWHPWRRYWASQRTEGSVDQIMAAGGWEDFRTFKNSYRKLDRDTAIKVLNEPAARRLADGQPAHPLYPTVGQPPSQPSGPGRPGVPALSLVRRRPGPGRSA